MEPPNSRERNWLFGRAVFSGERGDRFLDKSKLLFKYGFMDLKVKGKSAKLNQLQKRLLNRSRYKSENVIWLAINDTC